MERNRTFYAICWTWRVYTPPSKDLSPVTCFGEGGQNHRSRGRHQGRGDVLDRIDVLDLMHGRSRMAIERREGGVLWFSGSWRAEAAEAIAKASVAATCTPVLRAWNTMRRALQALGGRASPT